MQLKTVLPYSVQVSLTPEDCAILARACRVAADHLVDFTEPLDVLGSAIQAAGIAAYIRFSLSLDQQQELDAELKKLGLLEA